MRHCDMAQGWGGAVVLSSPMLRAKGGPGAGRVREGGQKQGAVIGQVGRRFPTGGMRGALVAG